MRRSIARFSGLEILNRNQSLADFITITCGFRFSVHTGEAARGLFNFVGSFANRLLVCIREIE
jgi:hypothetical protein